MKGPRVAGATTSKQANACRLLRSQTRRCGLRLGEPARPGPRQPSLYHRPSSHLASTGHFYWAANRTFLLGVDRIDTSARFNGVRGRLVQRHHSARHGGESIQWRSDVAQPASCRSAAAPPGTRRLFVPAGSPGRSKSARAGGSLIPCWGAVVAGESGRKPPPRACGDNPR